MKHALALALVAVVGCKGKDAAPKDQPAAKPAEPAVAKPADPAVKPADPAPTAPVNGPVKLATSDSGADCLGFVDGGKGAYFVTRSSDTNDLSVALVALGTAENPKLEATSEKFESAEKLAEVAPTVAKMNAFLAGKPLAPCTAWKQTDKAATGKLGGNDVTLSAKGTTLKIVIGKTTVERQIEGGAASAFVDAAFSSAEANTVAIVVNATAEAMNKYEVVWIGADDKK